MPPADLATAPVPPGRPAGAATWRSRLAGLPWPAIALLVLATATFVGFLVYPTYPNYDSYYSMLWGREILHGHLPSFDVYRTPTEHPLAIAFGAALSLLGRGGDRVMVFCTEASFVVLCAGVYRLARRAFTPLVGLAAAGILCTRFDFPFLAARAYIDIPYLVFVVWAAAFELERPRRGGIVWVLLACAGLLRPEAWILIGLYFLWMASGELGAASAAQRVRRWTRYAAVAAIGPVVWVAVDFIVTGHPFFSLQHTSGLADELGRTKGLSEVPSAMKRFFYSLAKAPVIYAAIAGFVVALWLAPRRVVMPTVLWLIGTGTFVLVGIAGLSVIDRYLLVPTLMVMVFAAVSLAGWTMLREDLIIRKVWAVAAGLIVVYGVVFTATRVNLRVFDSELKLRGDSHHALVRLLDQPRVRAALHRCGPLSTPSHKLVPDSRWVLGAGAGGVLARADPAARTRIQRGVALYVVDRAALLRQALVDKSDDVFNDIPMSGFSRLAFNDYYSVYVRC
ncbi:hypothetical protein FSW04_14405 [Baekduia soli]|uniref:Glycosyltransferase RgtA/B/C/D-like domain-containing protein n=1 Tax=Baekduia soli TaxID=496014 RepID=A0A5B8U6N3_9ACTN|nr:hypothetical protein [Baekduia soli]QEC48647.1 hypothetical protein FSW04_14405 [Baekduia soli]